MQTLPFMIVCTGALLSLLSVPLILRWVGPNPFYGLRVKATLKDPQLWFDVNSYAGWWMLAAGLSAIFAALALAFVPGITTDEYSLACLAVGGVVLVVGLVQSARYIRSHSRR
jgi:hypothetical protein